MDAMAEGSSMDAMAEGSSMAEGVNENDIQEGVAMASGSVGNSPEPRQALDSHGKPQTPILTHPQQTALAEPRQALAVALAEPRQASDIHPQQTVMSEPRQPLDTHGKPQPSSASLGRASATLGHPW